MKRIPTILGLLLVVVMVGVVAVTSSGVKRVTQLFSHASASLEPVGQVGFANITDNSFTVTWRTQEETVGTVFYGQTKDLEIGAVVDDREIGSNGKKYLLHLVRIINLKPQTKYYLRLGVKDGTTAPFEVTTGPKLEARSSLLEPIFGQVVGADGSGVSGSLVFWEATGSSKLAALSKTDGSFVLPITTARVADLSSYYNFSADKTETVSVDNGAQTATIVCVSGKDRPLPTVKLGEQIQCEKQKIATVPSAEMVATQSGVLRVEITEGETVSTPLPTISGKAGPNQTVKITVNSATAYTATIKADPDGSWSWTPPVNLVVGQHVLTVSVINSDGSTEEIKRNFTVSANEPILPITSGTPSAQVYHFACQGEVCAKVLGDGSNACSTDSDCAPQPIATPSPEPVEPIPPPQPATGAQELTKALLIGGILLGIGGVAAGLLLF